MRDAALAKRCSRGWDGRCCHRWGRLHQITAVICWEGGEERLHVSGTLRRRSDASGDTAAPLLRHPAVRICRPAAGPAALGCRAQQPASVPCPALLASPCSLLGSATTRRPARVLQHHEVPALLLPVPMSSRRPLGRIPHSERLCPAQLSPVLALTEQSTAMPATSRSFVLSPAFPCRHWCSPAPLWHPLHQRGSPAPSWAPIRGNPPAAQLSASPC